jgi:hypothetical protein
LDAGFIVISVTTIWISQFTIFSQSTILHRVNLEGPTRTYFLLVLCVRKRLNILFIAKYHRDTLKKPKKKL